jgi:hypothetical protein
MKMWKWLKDRVAHKLHHVSFKSLKQIMKKHGLALVVIIVMWEIIEDILFPVLFAALGKYVHPVFYSGVPAAWVLCLHWLAVPIMWKIWIKISNKNIDVNSYKC